MRNAKSDVDTLIVKSDTDLDVTVMIIAIIIKMDALVILHYRNWNVMTQCAEEKNVLDLREAKFSFLPHSKCCDFTGSLARKSNSSVNTSVCFSIIIWITKTKHQRMTESNQHILLGSVQNCGNVE